MTTTAQLMETLPAIKSFDYKDGEIIDVFKRPHAFIKDGTLIISAENGDGLADYYGEFEDGPYIHPDLEAWAEENGGMWEWESPGAIGFYK